MPDLVPVSLIRAVEERAANAWPAEVVQELDGWRLRYAEGVTRRANSVWPNRAGDRHSLEERLSLAEEFYHRRNQPTRFHICPAAQPSNLDAHLEALAFAAG